MAIQTTPLINRSPHLRNLSPASARSISPTLSEKELSQCRDILAKIGSPKNPKSRNTTDIDYIVRAVMRHPSQEALQVLSELHQILKSKFLTHSDEGIDWLLGGCSSTARGGFKNASSVKKFLETPPESIPSSRLITGLETLITAITYRIYKDRKATPPHIPETPEQQSIYSVFADIYPAYKVPDHSTTYPDSRKSLSFAVTKLPIPTSERYVILSPREDLSEGSGVEEESLPSRRLNAVVFVKKLGRDRTWVGAADEGNIPTRLGISGSTVICLSTIEWLLGKSPGELDQQTVELITGVLLLPTFIRGDYHSVAEIAAALQHFLACRKGGDPSTAVLSPQAALKKGLNLLHLTIDPNFKGSVEEISLHILKSTKSVEYPYTEEERPGAATLPFYPPLLGTAALEEANFAMPLAGIGAIAPLPRNEEDRFHFDSSDDEEGPRPAIDDTESNSQANLGQPLFGATALTRFYPKKRDSLVSDSSDEEGPRPAGIGAKKSIGQTNHGVPLRAAITPEMRPQKDYERFELDSAEDKE